MFAKTPERGDDVEYLWVYHDANMDIDFLKTKNISSVTKEILSRRGISSEENMEKFLYPSITDFHDPLLLHDMEKARDRILKALKENEKIIVYGDYDVDGMTSVALLYLCLTALGADVSYYIPDRLDEGYGLNLNAVKQMKEDGVDLIITVDSGITGIEEGRYLKENQLDMIITDHHTPGEILPEAYAIINPKCENNIYPFLDLAGVGVAFKLVQALIGIEESMKYLDIVAIGTIADMVSILDENRVIVKYGLEKIQKTKRPGIQALIEQARLKDKKITTDHIGYGIAPRINATGRMGNPYLGVQLLTTDDELEAFVLSRNLEEENERRKKTEEEIILKAEEMIKQEKYDQTDTVFVIYNKDWHSGVIGIVASRILEKFYKPTIILTEHEGYLKGSARSIEGINMYDLLNRCSDTLLKFGGHSMAAGLTMEKDKLEEFRLAVNKACKEMILHTDPELMIPKKEVDAKIHLNEINPSLLDEFTLLEPYGLGNPKPMLAAYGLKVKDFSQIGIKQNHLKLNLSEGKYQVDGIYFNHFYDDLGIFLNADIDVMGYLELNEYNGVAKPQFLVKDIHVKYDGNPFYEKLMKNFNHYLEVNGLSLFLDQFEEEIPEIKMENVDCYGLVTEKYGFIDSLMAKQVPVSLVAFTFQEAFRLKEKYKNGNIELVLYPTPHFLMEFDQKKGKELIISDCPFTLFGLSGVIDFYNKKNCHFIYGKVDYTNNMEMLHMILPEEGLLRNLYKLLLYLYQDGEKRYREIDIIRKYFMIYRSFMTLTQLKAGLIILKELGLIDYQITGGIVLLKLSRETGKVDLRESDLFLKCEKVFISSKNNYCKLLSNLLE